MLRKLGYKSFPRTTPILVGKVIGRAYEKTQALAGVISGVSRSILALTPAGTIRISPLIRIIDLDQAIFSARKLSHASNRRNT
jgi:hypothetical protein